jgi:hypothetical protein
VELFEKGKKRMKLQRLGGYAAIASVLALGPMLVIALQLGKRFGNLVDPTKFTAAITTAPVAYSLVNLLHIAHFIFWQILFFALHERMQNKAPQLTRIALIAVSAGTAIMVAGFIIEFEMIRMTIQHRVPMEVLTARQTTMSAIGHGLLLAAFHFYGWAGLLIGWAIVRVRPFSTIPGWLFVVTGFVCILAFVLYVVPNIGPISHIIASITAIWIGIALLRQKQPQSALDEPAASK